MLLHNLPELADPQQQELHRNIRTLVERAAVQQRPTVRGRLRPNYDSRNVMHSRQLAHCGANVDQATADVADAHQPREAPPRRGSRLCDQDGEQSPSPDGPSPRAFGRCIQKVPFPPCFRPSTNIAKYTRETNPAVWLEDFRLACRAGGADDDYFIIQHLPICVRK
ncbi:putative prpol [Panicum miliaceum]|uniref:Prpol n=1 Tax=Panicum miliaceum TaxID=4540 RepID=A0A3L6R953_PANMI|nr:putative prpol [Panicum miliaceum]